MKVFLSPAKNMRAAPAMPQGMPEGHAPRYLYKTEALAASLQRKAPYERAARGGALSGLDE